MLRDPDLTPEPWRKRQKFRPHPLLALPLFPLVGFLVLLARAIHEPSVQAWVWAAHLLALTLVASVASCRGGRSTTPSDGPSPSLPAPGSGSCPSGS